VAVTTLLLSSLGLLLLPWLVHAQCPGLTTVLVPFAKEKLTVSTVPKSLTQAIYQQSTGVAALATIQVQDAPVLVTDVGVPTLTEGTVLQTLQSVPVCGIDAIRAFRAIRQSTDAVLIVRYYRAK
jgi:hypothetical protein